MPRSSQAKVNPSLQFSGYFPGDPGGPLLREGESFLQPKVWTLISRSQSQWPGGAGPRIWWQETHGDLDAERWPYPEVSGAPVRSLTPTDLLFASFSSQWLSFCSV